MVIATYLHDPLVHWVSALALGLLMGSAALHKLRDQQAFARVLLSYSEALGAWLPAPLRKVLQVVLPWAELSAAGAMLASPLLASLVWPAVMLLGVYALVLAASVRSGRAIADCGCHFGSQAQAPSVMLVWRNLLLMMFALNLVLPMYERSFVWLDVITLVFMLLATTAFYLVANLLIANRTSLRGL